eukprot:scaffold34078_cov40-Phaeocystis_antarctica.AAC.1
MVNLGVGEGWFLFRAPQPLIIVMHQSYERDERRHARGRVLDTTWLLNPLPWPGNGNHPETPLSRLTPNVGENHPYFMPGTPPQHACATLLG